jgi:hypothetical protein
MNTGEMIDQCLDRLGAGRQSNSRLTSKILAQLNAAYSTLCGMQNWYWLRARTTIDFVANDAYLALPTTTRGGVTVNAVSRVLFVTLQDLGRVLRYEAEFNDLVEAGSTLGLRGTGTPESWCVTMDADGVTKAILLIPQPGYADTAIVYYLRSFASLKLIANTDVPAFDEEYHQYIVEKAMSLLTSMDATFDGQVGATCRKEAGLIYRAMMHTHVKAQPVFNPRHWPGHGSL